MQDLFPLGAEAIGFDPPAPVLLNEGGRVAPKAVLELVEGMRVALPDPRARKERYLFGVIQLVNHEFVLGLDDAFGKLQRHRHRWVCTGLAKTTAIAEGLGLKHIPSAPRSFTSRLLRRAARRKR